MCGNLEIQTWQERHAHSPITMHICIACKCGDDMIIQATHGEPLNAEGLQCDCGADYRRAAADGMRRAFVSHNAVRSMLCRWN